MPSSMDRRTPARTLSAIGLSRASVMVNSLILNSSNISDTPNGNGSAPEQQEQHTNITVHSEKRSVELAEVVRFDQRVLVGEQRGHHNDSGPGGPGQRKAERQPREQRHDSEVHYAGYEQRVGNAEAFGNGKQAGLLIKCHVLTSGEHVESADPESNRGAEDEHARLERTGDGDPCSSRGDAEREA